MTARRHCANRWVRLAVVLTTVAVLGAGCSAARGRPTATSGTSSARTTRVAAARCSAEDLRADQHPVSEGAGQYDQAWSLTNTSARACHLTRSTPHLALDDAAGRSVVHYEQSTQRAGAASELTIQPGHAAWFLTEESAPACTGNAVTGGGPFHYSVLVPGGTGAVLWAPAYLRHAVLSNYCATVPLAVFGIQGREPAAP